MPRYFFHLCRDSVRLEDDMKDKYWPILTKPGRRLGSRRLA
jgi:hypothetical protein